MSDPSIPPPFSGPWPDGHAALRIELDRYLDDVRGGAVDGLITTCDPWTVRDVTAHLTQTFRRFTHMVEQGRNGDFTPPFPPEELDAENLRAVAEFTGNPTAELPIAAHEFLELVDDLDEPVPHQLGTLPMGLQVLFGLFDLAMHHHDVLAAAGGTYEPTSAALEAIRAMGERLFQLPSDVPWETIVAASGRAPI
ncbi:MAG TPA: maleylpyruvate isomerase family mycothiol-dependent enzyme [Microthrixaceae bacterium]|nr:maleylpyruvate isomerase family mycothiol-dependent enzyme [Microthrixaceae bacterium]